MNQLYFSNFHSGLRPEAELNRLEALGVRRVGHLYQRSALSSLCPWSFPALRSPALWIQCNLRCPTLAKYPPALIQVTLHRRVQQGFQDSAAAAAQVDETLRTWQRACWSKRFRSALNRPESFCLSKSRLICNKMLLFLVLSKAENHLFHPVDHKNWGHAEAVIFQNQYLVNEINHISPWWITAHYISISASHPVKSYITSSHI